VPECFKDDEESQWKPMDKWEIRPPPLLIPTPLNRWSLNLAWVMTSGSPSCAKLYYDRIRVFAPRPAPARAGAYKMTLLVFWGFWRRRTEKTPEPIFTIYMSNDVVSRKGMSFGGPENKISHFDPIFPPKANFWLIFDGT